MTPIERNFLDNPDKNRSGVSWAAIFAGAAGAAALSLILLVLGVGLGFSAVSPWSNTGASAAAIGTSTIVWLAFTQIVASGVGGYLAGRLRVKWASMHTDEVYFRDTAHGFLAWAIASLITAGLLGSAIGSVISGGVSAGATVASTAVGAAGGAGAAGAAGMAGNMQGGGSDGSTAYIVDSMLRTNQATPDATGSAANAGTASGAGAPANPAASDNAMKMEITRIFINGVRAKGLPQEDRQYLAQVIAKRTGLSPADADRRVADAYSRTQTAINNAELSTKQAADAARKTAAYTALWMFVALLCGAFVASLSATFGGKQRDHVVHHSAVTA